MTDAGFGTGLLIPNQEFLVTAGSFTHLSFSLPKPRVLPLDYDSWNSSLSLKLWSDYTTDDLIIEATARTPSSGHSALLVSRGTGVDGVARFDFGVRRPTGPVTFAFEPVRASVKFARAPGLLRIEVNGIAVSLLEIIPAPALTADTGIDGLTANYDGIAKVNVPFPGLWVEVEEARSPYGNPDRPPFIWRGRSDSDGRFAVNAPAGAYNLKIVWPAIANGTTSFVSTAYFERVTVVSGQRASVVLQERTRWLVTTGN